MARGTQHRKRRPTANARTPCARRPARSREAPSPVRRPSSTGCAPTRSRSSSSWRSLRARIRLLRRRLRLDRDQRRAAELLQRNLGQRRLVALKSLQKADHRAPEEREGLARLATKLEQDNKDDDAITALPTYTALQAEGPGRAARAGRHLSAGTTTTRSTSTANGQAPRRSAQRDRSSGLSSSKLGKALGAGPIDTALPPQAQTAEHAAIDSCTACLPRRSIASYKKLAALRPKDATTQYSTLAQAAQERAATRRPRSARSRPRRELAPGQKQQLDAKIKAHGGKPSGSTPADRHATQTSRGESQPPHELRHQDRAALGRRST